MLLRPVAFHHRPELLLRGVRSERGGPLPSIQSSGEALCMNHQTGGVVSKLYVCVVALESVATGNICPRFED